MRNPNKLLAVSLLAFCLAQPVIAQQEAQSASAVEREVNDAIARVNAAIAGKKSGEILSISGIQKIDDQVLYLDTLRFDNGATMQLKAEGRDAIYIVAREVRLSGPDFKAAIEFYDREPINGADGATPPPALAQLPRSGGNGEHGRHGTPGSMGDAGQRRPLPTIYLVVGQIRQSTGGVPDFSDWRIFADGIDGGTGGKGGRGQNGQPGQDGRHGSSGTFDCSSGPRSGGNGGNGGAFGPGGRGGDGGDGANIVFIVPPTTVDAVKDVRVRNRGGLPGEGGLNGSPGSGAGGGSRGSAPGMCSAGGAHAGSGGNTGTAATPNSRGLSGERDGQRGRVFYYTRNFFN